MNNYGECLLSRNSVKGLLGWFFDSLPNVGSQVGSLLSVPTATDHVSKVGCKSQTYTTWNEISRSYVASVLIRPNGTHQPLEMVDLVYGDVPTHEELQALSLLDRKLLSSGARLYIRGVGVLTKHQATARAHARIRRAAQRITTRATAPVDDDPPQPDPNLGFYYSDVLPVRVTSVSSMTSWHEQDTPIPFSPVYQALAGRLNDPAQTGVLSAVVKGAKRAGRNDND